jgi:hypothetical protein
MYKSEQIPTKAKMERMYTHKGRGFAGIFSGACTPGRTLFDGVTLEGGAE